MVTMRRRFISALIAIAATSSVRCAAIRRFQSFDALSRDRPHASSTAATSSLNGVGLLVRI